MRQIPYLSSNQLFCIWAIYLRFQKVSFSTFNNLFYLQKIRTGENEQ